MSSPFGRVSNSWSTNGSNALPSARVDGSTNPFAAPATAFPKVTSASSPFTFPTPQQPQQQAPWGSAWAAQPFTSAGASPFAPTAAPKTVFGPGSVSGVNTNSTTFSDAWRRFQPAPSGSTATPSTKSPFAPATAAGSNGGFRLGQANASTFQWNQQTNATGTSTFDWSPQQRAGRGDPFSGTAAVASATVGGAQQPAVNPFAPRPAFPAGKFFHDDGPALIRSKPAFTWAQNNNNGRSTDAKFSIPFSEDPPLYSARKETPLTPAPTSPWASWSCPTTTSTETRAPSAWTFPSTASTEAKAPHPTWTFPAPTTGAAGGTNAPSGANNGFKFTWKPAQQSATASSAGANVAATGSTNTWKFQWLTANPTSIPTVAAPTATPIAPSAPQPPAAPQFLIAQADVDPYGTGAFGAGLVEQQVKAALGSSNISASASVSASNSGKSTNQSVEALSLTPTPRRRSPQATKRVGLSPNAMASPSATILRPKQPMMMLQRLSGTRSSWARNEFRRSGSLFHR